MRKERSFTVPTGHKKKIVSVLCTAQRKGRSASPSLPYMSTLCAVRRRGIKSANNSAIGKRMVRSQSDPILAHGSHCALPP
jgi:hypothetical protein